MKASYLCSHCKRTCTDPVIYAEHVVACISETIRVWDEEEYSKRYFEQVRAISRYRGDIKRRSKFKSWAWWAVKPDGPALVQAEVAG